MDITPLPFDETFMREALAEAESALQRGDRPIGAVIVHDGRIIARASNTFSSGRSNVAHAEMNAIIQSADYLQRHGRGCTIYTTCEPCVMCLGAIVIANIREIVFGMPDNYIKARLVIEGVPYVEKRVCRYAGGVMAEECTELFRRYSEEEANLCIYGIG